MQVASADLSRVVAEHDDKPRGLLVAADARALYAVQVAICLQILGLYRCPKEVAYQLSKLGLVVLGLDDVEAAHERL